MKIKLVWTHTAGHSRVAVFVGPDLDHLALAGRLAFRPEEAKVFRSTIMRGVGILGSKPIGFGFDSFGEAGWIED